MTGLTFYCFVRIFDSCSIGKLSSLYNPTELKIFQIILPMIIESDKGYVSNNDIGKNSTSYSTVVFFLIKNKLFFFFWKKSKSNKRFLWGDFNTGSDAGSNDHENSEQPRNPRHDWYVHQSLLACRSLQPQKHDHTTWTCPHRAWAIFKRVFSRRLLEQLLPM